MNNLTTRKIVLGMLMALVLTFSVQGIADAQVTIKESSGDHQNQSPGLAFNSPLVFSANDVKAEKVQIRGGSQTSSVNAPSGSITISANSNVAITSVTISGKTAHVPTVAVGNSVTLNRPYTIEYINDTAEPPVKGNATNAKPHVDAVNTYNNARTTLRAGSNTIRVACRAMSAGIGTVDVTGKDSDFTLYVSSATSASAKLIDSAGSPDSAGVYDNRIKQSFEGEITFGTDGTILGNLVDFTVTSGWWKALF